MATGTIGANGKHVVKPVVQVVHSREQGFATILHPNMEVMHAMVQTRIHKTATKTVVQVTDYYIFTFPFSFKLQCNDFIFKIDMQCYDSIIVHGRI